MAAPYCDFYLRCGRMAVANEADCLAAFAESCEARYEPRYVALADAGLLELSAAGVEACAAHLASVACEQQIIDLDGPCASMWRGLSPAGSPCSFDVESLVCAPESACVLDPSFCGTCTPIATLGAACDATVTCGPSASCVSGTCQPRAAVGDTCAAGQRCALGAWCAAGVCVGPTYVGVGDACDDSHRCEYLTVCAGGRCIAGARLGEACDAGTPCATGWCSGGSCAAPQADGAPCAHSNECASWQCRDGSCAPLPSACFLSGGLP